MSTKTEIIEKKIAALREQLRTEEAADREREDRELVRLARLAGCTDELIRVAKQRLGREGSPRKKAATTRTLDTSA